MELSVINSQVVNSANPAWMLNVVIYDEIQWPGCGPAKFGEVQMIVDGWQTCVVRYIQVPTFVPSTLESLGHKPSMLEAIVYLKLSNEITEGDFKRAQQMYESYQQARTEFPGLPLEWWAWRQGSISPPGLLCHEWVLAKYPTEDTHIPNLLYRGGRELCAKVWNKGGYPVVLEEEHQIPVDQTTNQFTRIVIGGREDLVVATINGLVVLTQGGSGRRGRGGPAVIKPYDEFYKETLDEYGNSKHFAELWLTIEHRYKTEHGFWWDGQCVHAKRARFDWG